MRSFYLMVFLLLFFVCTGFAAIGDILCSFQVPNPDSVYQYKGLAKDPDGNIWITYMSGTVKYAKFDAITHNLINSWQISSLYQCQSLGYGYYQNGVNNLVFYKQDPPRLILWNPITNENNGSLLDPYNFGLSQCQVDVVLPSDYVYVTGGGNYPVKRSDYPVTQWYQLIAQPGYFIGGLAAGWGHLFISEASIGFNRIYQYNIVNGAYESMLNINGLVASANLGDIAIGRVNAVGDHESLFIAVYYPSNPSNSGICEIEIGDITDVSVIPTSLGAIKASFK